MLLSLTRRVDVTLDPERITIRNAARGWRRSLGAAQEYACGAADGRPLWLGALAALQHWLEQEGVAPGALEVDLSDRFVRYALVPWSDAVSGRAELEALARVHVEAIYGDIALGWQVLADMGEHGSAGIACALDTDLLLALRALCGAHRLRLAALQPRFMRIFNGARADIGSDALIACVEPGQCVLASRRDGAWHSIRTVRCIDSELPLHIEREIVLQGLDAKVVRHVHAPAAPSATGAPA